MKRRLINMKKYLIIKNCNIAVDDITTLALNEGELYTMTSLKYDYAIKYIDEKLEALISAECVKVVDVKKSSTRKEIRASKADGKQFTRYSQKKVKLSI